MTTFSHMSLSLYGKCFRISRFSQLRSCVLSRLNFAAWYSSVAGAGAGKRGKHYKQEYLPYKPMAVFVINSHKCNLTSCNGVAVGVRHQTYQESSSSSGTGSGINEANLKKEIDTLTDQFMATRELLEEAMESKGSVYFNDDLEEAKQAVQETLNKYRSLLERLSEEQERNVRRTIGLKMEELRAQENMILESLKED